MQILQLIFPFSPLKTLFSTFFYRRNTAAFTFVYSASPRLCKDVYSKKRRSPIAGNRLWSIHVISETFSFYLFCSQRLYFPCRADLSNIIPAAVRAANRANTIPVLIFFTFLYIFNILFCLVIVSAPRGHHVIPSNNLFLSTLILTTY